MNSPAETAAEAVPPRLGLIACRVFEDEIALHGGRAPRILVTRFLEVRLHDQPDGLRAALQKEINAFLSVGASGQSIAQQRPSP